MSTLSAILLGIIAGMVIMFLLVRSSIGDDYTLKKPKVKGQNNLLKIFTNIKKDESKKH